MRQPFLRISALLFTLVRCAGQDSAVVINEVQFHPANELTQSEWIELRCLHGVNVDISGWRLEGGIDYTFPAGTVVQGRGSVLVAQNPAAMTGITAFGPWTGKLDNGGEEVRLVNVNDRVMDRISYSDDGDWPVGPDGSGATLARREQNEARSGPGAWTTSNELGGTPGTPNFHDADSVPIVGVPLPIDSGSWKYSDSDTAQPANWKDPGFAETGWNTGRAIFYRGPAIIADPLPTAVRFPLGATATPLTDNFAAAAVDPVKWEVIDQGLESTAASGIIAAQSGGQLTVSGATSLAAWAGQSLRSVQTFSTRSQVTTEVDRVSLTGTGAGMFRSSLWLWADATHYLHFSQATGTIGWTFNANDAGGTGTLTATGNGTGLSLDPNTGPAHLKLVWLPGTTAARGTIQIWHNAFLAWSHNVTNWPSQFQVLLTGQARTIGSTVNAVFDNAKATVIAAAPLQTVVNPATTHYFRNTFAYSGDPAITTLTLWPIHDDGAVYYLNGTEVYRDNVSAGQSHGTLATAPVIDATFPVNPIPIPAGTLVSGTNVLAVEVHQENAASPDMVFGAQLMTSALPPEERTNPSLRLSEVSGAAEAAFRIELVNASGNMLNLSGFTVGDSSGHSHPLSGTLASGGFLVLDQATLGFRPAQDARLFVLQGSQLHDARTVTGRLRGLNAKGLWAYPSAPSFSSANGFIQNDSIVINEIMAQAPSPSPEQWVELYNRGAAPVDLSGWQFTDGITYEFPAGTPTLPPGQYALLVWDVEAFNALHPGVSRVFGPYDGSLAGKGERLRLRDGTGNIADELRYADTGPWPEFATGSASTLELRNPQADNANGASWAASNETSRGSWQDVSYTFPGTVASTNPTYYSELILGMINDGEVLVDDVSVRLNPAAANTELIQNGDFSIGTTDKWRFPGNHRRSTVVDDPSSPGNPVLKLVSGGSLDHMSNHAETTLKNGATLMGGGALSPTATFSISFRARWWKGNNALNSHLYFNRGPRTTLLDRPFTGGTPGAANSTFSATATISLGDVTHSPAVPAASQVVTVTARADDPAGTAALTLIYAVNAGAEQTVPMTQADGKWSGTIPGQALNAKAVFRIEAQNALGHTAVWPANGMAGRAMIPWNDNQAQLVRPSGARPHNFRIVLTAADITLLHAANNVMSNDWMPCTAIYDERDVYYGTSVHLKGSEHGRAKDVRVGFLVRFPSDHLFLGIHDEVGVDRSGAGDQFSQKEILVKRSMNRAGGIPSTEDDLIRVIAPRTTHTGPAIFIHNKLDSDNFLEAQFDNGSSGTMFEYELIYPLSTTDGGLEGNKLTQDGGNPGPAGVSVGAIKVPGTSTDSTNKEDYRWFWLIKNNRTRDDYAGLITGLTALGKTGATFHTATAPVIDTQGFLRSFTGPVAWGAGDNYVFGAAHNALYYVKPDGRVLYIPWDMDFTASQGATDSVAPTAELQKMINSVAGTTVDEVNKRAYYGYLLHMVNTGFNPGYLAPWMDHYTSFVNENFRSGFLTFVTTRATHIRTQVNTAVPFAPFVLSTQGGNDFSEPLSTTTLAGNGWVNVDTIRLAGGEPLAVTWTDQDSWSMQLPVFNGANVFNIEARDPQGNIVGTDSITVTGTGGVVPASSANIALTELNYNPVTPGEEFLELLNVSAFTVELAGCAFTQGLEYTFPPNTQLAAGARLVLAENRTLFAARYPAVTALAPGQYTPSNLSNGGETVTLLAADGLSNIFTVSYSDSIDSTDGGGSSLIRSLASTTPDLNEYVWRASTSARGNPGTTDAVVLTGSPTADGDGDGFIALIEHALGTSDANAASFPAPPVFVQNPSAGRWHASFTSAAAADDVAILPEVSANLSGWTAPELAQPTLPAFRRSDAPGAVATWTSGPEAFVSGQHTFLRIRVSLR